MGDFPYISLLPKEETKALEFIRTNPTYDGRNVIVAVLDTGVDLGAAGLAVCSDGRPKVIDCIDATGSGDVEMKGEHEIELVNDESFISSASGRKIKVYPHWVNPLNKYKVGSFWAYNVYPKALVSRLKEVRKERWDAKNRLLETELQRNLLLAKGKDDKALVSECEARIEVLKELGKTYTDYGPLVDCISWFDGNVWRAVLDTKETGDVSHICEGMTDYKRERQFGTFCEDSLLNYCVNFYDNGSILSVVSDVGAHGTHVAGIIGAFHPENPDLNGVAPGCQIISIRIGDARLGSMETNTGLERAMKVVVDSKVDVVNMSYGEPTSLPNRGRFIELVNEVVNKNGIIFVASAGNDGPALSSVGAPGGSTDSVMGIGAYVSQAMMRAAYSMKEPLPEPNNYTWSSRGPSADGDYGVSVSAPGAAIASIPNWCLSKSQLMNGTSMSSPNAAGNIACLLSAAKACNVNYTATRIRRTIENTASLVEGIEKSAIGCGLINIIAAFEYLKKNALDGSDDVRVEVSVSHGSFKGRGVYLRDLEALKAEKVEAVVSIKPCWQESVDDGSENRKKTSFEKNLILSFSSVSGNVEPVWLTIPSAFVLMNAERSFDVVIHPKLLKPGVHYGDILAHDAETKQLFFKVPVTVIMPTVWCAPGSSSININSVKFRTGTINRHFISVPCGASWVDITLNSVSDESSKTFSIHLMQILPGVSKSATSKKSVFKMSGNTSNSISMNVTESALLEVCIAQYWNQTSESCISIDVEFHGLTPENQQLVLIGSSGFCSNRVTSFLPHGEMLKPDVSLTKWRSTLNAKSFSIKPLGTRDNFFGARQLYQLQLRYEFKASDKNETITPSCPMMNNLLYESPFGSCTMLFYTGDNRYIGMSDAFPEEIKLGLKGDYYVLLFIKHDKLELLETLVDLQIYIERKLSKISLKVYETLPDLLMSGQEFKARRLNVGETVSMYISFSAVKDKIPKTAVVGDHLVGTITYVNRSSSLSGSSSEPGGLPITVIVSLPSSEKKSEDKNNHDDKDTKTRMEEAIATCRIKELRKLCGKGEFSAFYEEACLLCVNMGPEIHLDLKEVYIKHLNNDTGRSLRLKEIVQACDEALALIDLDKLSASVGLRATSSDETKDGSREKKLNERRKAFVIEMLHTKLKAIIDLSKESECTEERRKVYNEAFYKLEQWTDVSVGKFILTCIEYDILEGNFGKALKAAQKILNDKISSEVSRSKAVDLMTFVLQKLGWLEWMKYLEGWKRCEFQ